MNNPENVPIIDTSASCPNTGAREGRSESTMDTSDIEQLRLPILTAQGTELASFHQSVEDHEHSDPFEDSRAKLDEVVSDPYRLARDNEES